jgi:hypothetical protein
MNESSECVGGDDAEKPKDTQNDENRPKHVVPISQGTLVESACVAPGEGFADFLEDPIVDESKLAVCPLRHTFDYFLVARGVPEG